MVPGLLSALAIFVARRLTFRHAPPARFPALHSTKVPTGPDWLHEIKHDGYRLIVQRDGAPVRLHATIRSWV